MMFKLPENLDHLCRYSNCGCILVNFYHYCQATIDGNPRRRAGWMLNIFASFTELNGIQTKCMLFFMDRGIFFDKSGADEQRELLWAATVESMIY
jgi:hypothetical protein